ncbi:hydantoinase/oxoprolinase family protein [Denitrobaculum tricleocarpae]|uniref:Hydantoinase/oxoprolinase family protein n=1 Tax=Denitrobaculum tricleocarpae TaxID=2591009 RepID=A0A545STR1_9PROT|nr:hydantoinase/oxoprolinase family protein [Denitrobaculum tricleocarpae]TQV68331.1 hydantoinase/oxoprolinase family protein [Denitrobaculum tricleocarpae]
MEEATARLGVDIGGTFTDVVLERGGEVCSAKVLTTPSAPENAILEGLGEVLSKAGLSAGDISVIIHGTTLATNALIERRGAKTALITTQGFRDVIEMRSESRFEQYDLNLVLPEPLIARAHRYTLPERIGAQGQVLKPLDPSDIERLTDEIERGGYDSVAIGLIHAYMNPAHEEMVREILLARLPALSVSVSSEVSPQMREFERFNTVCANAYVKPLMKSYLDRLVSRLGEMGADCPVFMMHSGGGIISLESASEFPVRLVESGPAGGAIFAADIAARYGIDSALSFDMGGTTAKICLIKDQTPKTSTTFEVARTTRFKKGSGMPISIPVIEMVEIGAGGGSLAHVDSLQQIRVGPESAGSEPGPACYRQGGERPAVTDADLLLGRLDPENFAGGSIRLSGECSAAAVKQHVGMALELNETTAAFGISEVVDENMANAARVHAVENGEDLSGYSMIAFGGAAPLHAGRLCEKLGIERLLVPPGAGVGSAIGFLRAPFSFEATRSSYMRLSAYDPEAVRRLLDELVQEAEAFVRSCDTDSPLTLERKAYMRFVGQGWEIPVSLSEADAQAADSSAVSARFESAYRALFGRTVEGLDVEITSWSVRVSTPVPPVMPVEAVPAQREAVSDQQRALFDPVGQRFDEAQVIQRSALEPGVAVTGPAVIVESETSIIVPPGFQAVMQTDGCVMLGRNATGSGSEATT